MSPTSRGPRSSLTYTKPSSLVAVGLNVYCAQVTGSKRGVTNKVCKETYFDRSNGACRVVGIATGYGPKGHFMAQSLSDNFPKLLFRKSARKDLDSIKATVAVTYTECKRELRAIKRRNKDSGAMFAAVLMTENALISLNVGGNKGVIGRVIGGIWGLYQLTWGPKPLTSLSKGLKGYQSSRQLLPAQNGTTFSQSVAMLPPLRQVTSGKSTQPMEIGALQVTRNDKFLILASSGFWDVVSSLEATQLVQSHWPVQVSQAASALANEAEQRWQAQRPRTADITVLLVEFLS